MVLLPTNRLARGTRCAVPLLALTICLEYASRAAAQEKITYQDHLLPIIQNNCGNCHNEQVNGYFSGQFRDIGLDASYSDLGLGAISGRAEDRGRFKVPNLRNVTLTAPYMHDGRFKTLDDVLDHYSHNINSSANLDTFLKTTGTGAPMRMNISAHENQAIIGFLGTLTDADMITNPAYSDPFKTK